MKFDVSLDEVLAARKIITDKLAIAIRQPSGIDEGRYANLLADVKALDEIAANVDPNNDPAFSEFLRVNGDRYKTFSEAKEAFAKLR